MEQSLVGAFINEVINNINETTSLMQLIGIINENIDIFIWTNPCSLLVFIWFLMSQHIP